MKFRTACPRCKTAMDLEGDSGKYDVACPSCGHGFSVVLKPADERPSPRADSTQHGAIEQKLRRSSAGQTEYLIDVGGKRAGPYHVEELLALRQKGQLPDTTRIIYPHEDWSQATALADSPRLLGELLSLSAKTGQHCPLPSKGGEAVVSDNRKATEPVITRRSAVSSVFKFFGVIVLIFCIFSAMAGELSASGICLACSFQLLLFSHLLDVFTDIRWFLKQLVDKK